MSNLDQEIDEFNSGWVPGTHIYSRFKSLYQLKPCPMCGNHSIKIRGSHNRDSDGDYTGETYRIKCECGVMVQVDHPYYGGIQDRDSEIRQTIAKLITLKNAWNRRYAPFS